MIIEALKNWSGAVEVDGSICKDLDQIDFTKQLHIKLTPKKRVQPVKSGVVRVTVKAYMTRKATPEFDFMARWNNDNPMPLRVMVGEKVKETAGMVYMKLHGDIYAERICTCMKCGRALTNPVSQYFGIGPECGNHNYVNPFDSKEELKAAVDAYRKELQSVTWEGWIIKSAITEEESIE